MSNLYELGDALSRTMREIDERLASTDGEFTPEMTELLDAAEGQWEEKVERVALYVRSLLGEAAVMEAEEGRLKKRRAATEKRAAWLRDVYLRSALETQQKTEVRGALATVKIGKNPYSVRCTLPVELVPIDWIRVKPSEWHLDKEKILAAHRAGESLPEGVTVERGTSVKIT